jgi:hypothetical protein
MPCTNRLICDQLRHLGEGYPSDWRDCSFFLRRNLQRDPAQAGTGDTASEDAEWVSSAVFGPAGSAVARFL